MEIALPLIPAKRYFTIGEVSDLCGVKPYVLRYWEQEFTQLKPMKRRGNRRYYQHHEVLLIRRIRGLLYDQGFTISGARNQLLESGGLNRGEAQALAAFDADVALLDEEGLDELATPDVVQVGAESVDQAKPSSAHAQALVSAVAVADQEKISLEQLRAELITIRDVLLA